MSSMGYRGQKTKVCTRCGKRKPIEGFAKKTSSPDGRQNYCKDCQKEYGAKWWASLRADANRARGVSAKKLTPRKQVSNVAVVSYKKKPDVVTVIHRSRLVQQFCNHNWITIDDELICTKCGSRARITRAF